MEEGRFDDLPEPIYVAGFIRLYANQLGLNGQLLVNEYREWVESENPGVRGNGSKGRIKSAPDVPIIVSDNYFQKNKVEAGPPTFKTIYFNLIMIVLVLGLVSYLGMTQFNNYSSQLESNSTIAPQAASSKLPGGEGAAGGTTSGAVVPRASSADELVLTAAKHVWVEVKSAATGDNLYIGFLEPGSKKTFDTPEQGLRIRAADGGDVNVSYLGKTGTLGAAGQETEKVYTPEAVSGRSEQASNTAAPATAAGNGSVTPAAGVGTAGSVTGSTAATGAVTVSKTGTAPPAVAAGAAAAVTPPHRHRSPAASTSTGDGQSYKYGEGRLDAE